MRERTVCKRETNYASIADEKRNEWKKPKIVYIKKLKCERSVSVEDALEIL